MCPSYHLLLFSLTPSTNSQLFIYHSLHRLPLLPFSSFQPVSSLYHSHHYIRRHACHGHYLLFQSKLFFNSPFGFIHHESNHDNWSNLISFSHSFVHLSPFALFLFFFFFRWYVSYAFKSLRITSNQPITHSLTHTAVHLSSSYIDQAVS